MRASNSGSRRAIQVTPVLYGVTTVLVKKLAGFIPRKRRRPADRSRCSLAVLLVFALLAPSGVLFAPPVPVPNLSTPGFQSSDLDPVLPNGRVRAERISMAGVGE